MCTKKKKLEEANKNDDGLWTKHSEFHWSRIVCEHKLDFWPSCGKFQYRGKIHKKDIYKFIESRK